MHTASSRQPFDGEVLAELSGHEAGPPELLLPVAMRLELVDEDGALLAPVPGQVALAVAGQVQPAHAAATRDRVLPYGGVDGAALPLDVAGKADVHGQESSHVSRIITGGMPLGRDGTDRAPESFHSIRQPMCAMNLNRRSTGGRPAARSQWHDHRR